MAVWDLRVAKEVLNVPRGIPGEAMAFSADSRWLAYAPFKGPMRLFDLTGKEAEKSLAPMQGPMPERLVFAPDGTKLAISIPSQGAVVVRELPTGKVIKSFPHPERPFGVDWSPDGNFLAVGCANGAVYLWSYGISLRPQAILTGHQSHVSAVAFNHGGDLLASRSWDGTTRLWDPITGRHLLSASGGFFRFSVDDTRLACTNATQVVIWQIDPARDASRRFPSLANLLHQQS
jgi:WD40 repeat protein